MRTKPSDAAMSAVFRTSIKFRPEAAGDDISRVALECVGTDVHASFGDYGLNSGRIIRLFVRRTRFLRTFVQTTRATVLRTYKLKTASKTTRELRR